ncbi:unnamed protein product, partial [Urochloa humidicola]
SIRGDPRVEPSRAAPPRLDPGGCAPYSPIQPAAAAVLSPAVGGHAPLSQRRQPRSPLPAVGALPSPGGGRAPLSGWRRPPSWSPHLPPLRRSRSPESLSLRHGNMVGPSSPLFLPLARAAVTSSPRCNDERRQSRDLNPQHLHPDLCLPTVPSNSGSPSLATDYRVGSPTDVTSPTPHAGSDCDDIEMCETEAAEGVSLSDRAKTAIEQATKRFRSNCWNEYEPILEEGVVVQGRCKQCDIVMAAKRGAGTSSLRAHLRRCKKRDNNLRIVQDLSSTLRSPSGRSLKDWSYDPDVSRYELMRMISLHGLPFLCLEYDGLRRL